MLTRQMPERLSRHKEQHVQYPRDERHLRNKMQMERAGCTVGQIRLNAGEGGDQADPFRPH